MKTWEFHHFNEQMKRIERHLLELKKQGEHTMAQIDDLNAKLDAVSSALDGVTTGLSTLKTDLDKTLADLAAKIAAGATPTDLTDTLAKAQAISDKIQPIVDSLTALDTESTSADA